MTGDRWEEHRLGDCATFLSGGTPSKRKPDYWNGHIPWVSGKDMKVSRLYETEDHITEAGASNGTRLVTPGTVLILVRGMALAKVFPVVTAMREVAFNQDVKAVKCNAYLDPRFLFYWLQGKSYEVLGLADEAAHGTKRLQMDRLQNLPIDLPPLQTQRKIAAVLSAYDDLIENNTRRIEILEEMAQAIYREWFVNFRFPGHEKVRIVDSELGPIPEGWEVQPFSDFASLSRAGINPSRFGDEEFAHFSIPAFDESKMPRKERGSTIKSNKYLLHEGCVLLSKINPRIPRVWLPFLDTSDRAITSTEFLVLIPKAGVESIFLYRMCRSDEFLQAFAAQSLGTSTSHQRVKPEDLLRMRMVAPPGPLIETYSSVVRSMTNLVHMLRRKNVNLRRTRDLLLPKLISGEVDVAQIDTEFVHIESGTGM